MSSSYLGLDLFGSGPHRFSQLPLGEYVLTKSRVDPFQAGSQAVGPLELTVVVRGRLIADSEDDLWSVRDAITDVLSHPPPSGNLKELGGRSWDDMAFVAFSPADRTDRGRKASIAYTATFVRFLGT